MANKPMLIVQAGGARLNVFGAIDDDDAIRLARDHWTECAAIDTAALNALDGGEVTVSGDTDHD